MKKGLCILVFGASGVGKSHACAEFVKANDQYLYIKASALLSKAAQRTPEQLRLSSPGEILANQRFLSASLAQARQGRNDDPVIVDAHAVIDNDRTLVAIPVEAVASMHPDGLILLEADANTVARRRSEDERQRPHRSVPEIKKEMNAERRAVESYASTLRIPLVIADASGPLVLEEAIQELQTMIAPPQ